MFIMFLIAAIMVYLLLLGHAFESMDFQRTFQYTRSLPTAILCEYKCIIAFAAAA